MKKISIILAVVIVFTVLALCLVACNPGEQGTKPDQGTTQPHEHSFGTLWKVSETEHWHECSCGEKKDVAKHINSDGDEICDICGYNMHIHTFLKKRDNTHHWEECECGFVQNKVEHKFQTKFDDMHHWQECACGATTAKEEHIDNNNDWACDVCQRKFEDKYAKLKEDVEFTKVGDGESAYWSIKARNKDLTTLHIPNVPIDGLYVGAVENSGFDSCTSLTSVILSDSVTSIGIASFMGCGKLANIVLPSTLTNIGENAFAYCPIEHATLPASAIGAIEKGKLVSVVINGGKIIGNRAFEGYSGLTSVTIGNSVTSIADAAILGQRTLNHKRDSISCEFSLNHILTFRSIVWYNIDKHMD